jgi:hypothetical protein
MVFSVELGWSASFLQARWLVSATQLFRCAEASLKNEEFQMQNASDRIRMVPLGRMPFFSFHNEKSVPLFHKTFGGPAGAWQAMTINQ